MSHNTLENYYKTMFALTHQQSFSISDLEGLISYELDIYVSLVKDHNAQLAARAEQMRLEQEALSRKRF